MTERNISQTPRVWTDDELEHNAQTALEEFVDRRIAEPEGNYFAHVMAKRAAVVRLFKILVGIDPSAPDPGLVRKVLLDNELYDALRYVAGPPVSEDDLGVIVTRGMKGVSRKEIRTSNTLPIDILALICRLSDRFRFPWVAARRQPSKRELRFAIQTTAALHAVQAVQTERRGYGRVVEQALESRLTVLGLIKMSGQNARTERTGAGTAYPARGRVTQPTHHPRHPYFYGECTVYGRKVDLFIPLGTGRMIALEAKDSSSVLNSKKRLLNDTAAKAKHYKDAGGRNIVSVALLSGVFKVADLREAQEAGLYLVWAHEMDSFVEWMRSQTADAGD